MARRTVRVDVPSGSPDDLIKLGQSIVTQHKAPGSNSTLDAGKMTQLDSVLTQAAKNNADAKSFDAQAQTARQQRDTLLGTGKGQTADTPGTALKLITYARDALLLANADSEETLSEYGFNVVVGTAKVGQRTPKTTK